MVFARRQTGVKITKVRFRAGSRKGQLVKIRKPIFESKRQALVRGAKGIASRSKSRLVPISSSIGKRLISSTKKSRKAKRRLIGRRISFTSISRKRSRRGSALRQFV
ncbi:hypothetical protein LCGC14_0464460 [marine sediment metagenome]|uniref:Uncharacterized protein n=1 Tax=marine sediment metagenome TaxID=412755 RepID=A0A0F9SJ57_9ZZZZ